MCGRFYVSEDGDITSWIDEANRKMEVLTGKATIHTGEIFPTDILAVIANGKKQDHGIFPMKWGYNIADGKRPLINARIETANYKPIFSESFGCRRCLIPADHYFEWDHPSAGKATKYKIRPDQPGMFFLAGLYRLVPESILPECVILTREPTAEIIKIHNRMPVILNDEQAEEWLCKDTDPEHMIRDIHYRMIVKQADMAGA